MELHNMDQYPMVLHTMDLYHLVLHTIDHYHMVIHTMDHYHVVIYTMDLYHMVLNITQRTQIKYPNDLNTARPRIISPTPEIWIIRASASEIV